MRPPYRLARGEPAQERRGRVGEIIQRQQQRRGEISTLRELQQQPAEHQPKWKAPGVAEKKRRSRAVKRGKTQNSAEHCKCDQRGRGGQLAYCSDQDDADRDWAAAEKADLKIFKLDRNKNSLRDLLQVL